MTINYFSPIRLTLALPVLKGDRSEEAIEAARRFRDKPADEFLQS